MTAVDVLTELSRLGVHLEVAEGNRLRFRPAAAVPSDLVQAMRALKDEMLWLLLAPPVPARIIGTTAVAFVTPVKTQPCFHCSDASGEASGECTCSLCAERQFSPSPRPGRCAACAGTRRLAWVGVVQ